MRGSTSSLARGGHRLAAAGRDGTWIAFGVWALVFAAMIVSLASGPRFGLGRYASRTRAATRGHSRQPPA